MKGLIIDLPTLAEEGQTFTGEIPESVFDLQSNDAKAVGPLSYKLFVQRFESELLLTGSLSAPFEFTCVRTIHPFTQTIIVENAAISIEIESSSQIDTTEALREEVLINFSADPRCDDADEPHECQIDPRYLAVDKPSEDDVKTRPRNEGDDRWSALDALKNSDPER